MKKLLFIIILVLISSILHSQVDTIKRYRYHTSSSSLFTKIDGKLSSNKKLKNIQRLDSIWESDTVLRCTVLMNLKSEKLKIYYDKGIETSYFGEYKEFYKNGKIKIHGYYTNPPKIETYSDSIHTVNSMSYPDSVWTFYSEKGKKLFEKRYKEGIAHGTWFKFDNRERKVIEKSFLNGKSNGIWWNYSYKGKNSRLGYAQDFYNGVQIGNCNQCTFEFDSENIDLKVGSIYPLKVDQNSVCSRASEIILESGKFYFIDDGIITRMREFKNQEIINDIKYDYR